jgi:hypothetical protein
MDGKRPEQRFVEANAEASKRAASAFDHAILAAAALPSSLLNSANRHRNFGPAKEHIGNTRPSFRVGP